MAFITKLRSDYLVCDTGLGRANPVTYTRVRACPPDALTGCQSDPHERKQGRQHANHSLVGQSMALKPTAILNVH